MTLSDRDRKILMVTVPLVLVLAYWFLLLSPKRESASEAAATLATEQARLTDAEASATTVRAAKVNFARDYAAVVALGKAIPTSVDMPSLLVQLEQAAKGTGIDLAGVQIGQRTPAAGAAATGTAPAAPDPAAPAQSAPGQAAAGAQGAATSATPPAPPTGDATAPAGPTDAAAAPTTGGLETVPIDFDFEGSFFELANFFHRLKRFVYVDGDRVRVRGRLLTIDAVEYEANPQTFPALTATVKASVYLTPKVEGSTAGATPAGPEAAPAATAPLSTASSGSGAPTPTAAATP